MCNMSKNKTEFLKGCILSNDVIALFEDIKGVLFFIKNKNCEFIWCNLLLAEHCGFKTIEEWVEAKNDFNVHSLDQAERYRNDDLEVMGSGKPKEKIVELFPNYLGDLSWFVTTKVPLKNTAGEVIGLYGMMQTYEKSHLLGRPLGEISKALDYIRDHYTEKVSNEDLAREVGLSVRQFEKRFKTIFKTTPHQYIIKLKILKACDLLLSKNVTSSEVAIDLGFYDQSAFNLHFKKHVGTSPLKYIKRHSP